MKLKKLNYNKINFITSYLMTVKSKGGNLNSQVYVSKNLILNSYKNLDINLKKIFKFIYDFHSFKKTIVFVGFTDNTKYNFSLLFNKFNYIFLKENIWVNGVLCNSKSLIPYMNSKRFNSFFKKEKIIFLKNFNSLVKLKKKPDLIILFNTKGNENLISEAIKVKIPIISFISEGFITNSEFVHSIFNFYNKYSFKIIIRLVYFLLSSIVFRSIKKAIK